MTARLQTDVLSPLESPGWDDSLAQSPRPHCGGGNDSCFFRTSAWAEVLSRTYGYRPVYFCTRDGDNPVGVMPVMEVKSAFRGTRGISLPFTDCCEPLLTDGIEAESLMEHACQYGREHGWKRIEIRGGSGLGDNPVASYYTHAIELEADPERMFARFRGSVRRNVRKARRESVEVSLDRSLESLREYYRLHCLTRKRHGLPPQPFAFFRNLHECAISRKQGFYVLGSHDGVVVAGAVFLLSGTSALFKFGASDPAYQSLRPSNLVMWKAIEWLIQQGYRSLCLGRTDLKNTGLRRFKLGWGASERMIHYYVYDLRRGKYVSAPCHASRLPRAVFRRTPISLLKVIGRLLYRHAG